MYIMTFDLRPQGGERGDLPAAPFDPTPPPELKLIQPPARPHLRDRVEAACADLAADVRFGIEMDDEEHRSRPGRR